MFNNQLLSLFLKRLHAYAFVTLWLITTAPNCLANDFKAGMEALEAGDTALTIKYWKPLAEAGDADAQFGLAAIYNDGMGVEQNYAEANYWLLRAAEQGYAAAQYNLGNAYKNATGMAVDPAMAVSWWRKAAEQNFAPAQFNLGSALLEGTGTVRDHAAGVEWYRRAAANGHSQAQSNLDALGKLADADTKPVAKPDAEGSAKSSAKSAAIPAAKSTVQPQTAPPPPNVAARNPAPPAVVTAPKKPSTTSAPIESGINTPAIAPGSQNSACMALLNQEKDTHTVQLMANQSEATARAYSAQHALSDTAICNYKVKDVRWFALLYGRYKSADKARQALAALPSEVRAGGGYVRRIAVIRRAVSK